MSGPGIAIPAYSTQEQVIDYQPTGYEHIVDVAISEGDAFARWTAENEQGDDDNGTNETV